MWFSLWWNAFIDCQEELLGEAWPEIWKRHLEPKLKVTLNNIGKAAKNTSGILEYLYNIM